MERPGGGSIRRPGSSAASGAAKRADPFSEYTDANKLGITLDIESEEGRRLFLRLVAKADVVVESFPPGHLATIGCSYEVMSGANPGLVLASVTGFGQTGPRSGYRSCDLVACAFGGQMYVTGEPAASPLRAYGEQSSCVASLFAAVGVLLALIKRRKTGKGEHIDISSQEAVAGTLDHVLVRYLYDGIVPRRQGSLAWNRSSFILPCRDGHIHVSIAQQWETLVEWVAAEGMAEDLREERWNDEVYRSRHVDHVMDVLRRWTLGHDVEELVETAQAMRFPWAAVARPADVASSPQLIAREFFRAAGPAGPGGGPAMPGMPYRFDGSSSGPARRAPLPGEDNQRVYRDHLGLSEEEVARLARSGII